MKFYKACGCALVLSLLTILSTPASALMPLQGPEHTSAVVHVQAKKTPFLDRPRKMRAMCGQLGCSWCCLSDSGNPSCSRFSRCGGSCGHFHCK